MLLDDRANADRGYWVTTMIAPGWTWDNMGFLTLARGGSAPQTLIILQGDKTYSLQDEGMEMMKITPITLCCDLDYYGEAQVTPV